MSKKNEIKNILVIVAHPDDEIIGCGGTIAKHINQGDKVAVLYVADGETSRLAIETQSVAISRRYENAENIKQLLGLQQVLFLGFADQRLDVLPFLDLVQFIEKVIFEQKPSTIYTHFSDDLNLDHQLVYRAVMTACRPVPDFFVREIYSFEVASSTEWNSSNQKTFRPNHVVDITDFLAIKQQALRIYDKEIRDFPHARSYQAIEHMAKLRGAQFGLYAAEVFQVERQILK
ncbi:MAG: PIG-L family deacetylase [Pseudomonadota bacterium]